MNEYQKLLNHYGVTSASVSPYAGMSAPVKGTDPALLSTYEDLLKKYNEDQDVYALYKSAYKQRLTRGPDEPDFQGDPLLGPKYAYGPGYRSPQELTAEAAAKAAKTASGTTPAVNPGYAALPNNMGGGDTTSVGVPGVGNPNSISNGLIGAIMGFNSTPDESISVTDAGTSVGPGTPGGSAATSVGTADGVGVGSVSGVNGMDAMSDSATSAGSGGGTSAPGGPGGSDGSGATGGDATSSSDGGASGDGGGSSGDGGASGDGGGSSGDGGGGGSSGGDGYALGGLIRKYAVGGAVEAPEQLGQYYGTEPVQTPSQAPAQDAAPGDGLQAMMQRYMGDSSAYGSELKLAREAASKETDSFNRMLETAMQQKTEGPSKAEMYFRLASAFGAPTKTGSFFEGLGRAGEVAADYNKETRLAQQGDIANRLKLGITAQQARMEAAKNDVNTVRTLAGEELKDKRAMAVKAMESYIASGKPQSEAGKIALDSGLKQGTPEYSAFVQDYVTKKLESGDMYKAMMASIAQSNLALRQSAENRAVTAATKLSPGEVKLKSETEDLLGNMDSAMTDLQQAFKLNPNTFDSSLPDRAQRKILEESGSNHPKVEATRLQENLLSKGAVSKLRASFGGNPTEGERNILLSLEGIQAKSIKEREEIMRNAYKSLQTSRAAKARRLADINAGLYRSTGTIDGAAGGLD